MRWEELHKKTKLAIDHMEQLQRSHNEISPLWKDFLGGGSHLFIPVPYLLQFTGKDHHGTLTLSYLQQYNLWAVTASGQPLGSNISVETELSWVWSGKPYRFTLDISMADITGVMVMAGLHLKGD